MRATAWRLSREARRPVWTSSCWQFDGAKHPLHCQVRNLHSSPVSSSTQTEPSPAKDEDSKAASSNDKGEETPESRNEETRQQIEPSAPNIAAQSESTPATHRRLRNAKGRIRGIRIRTKGAGLPPVPLPGWFWERNINPDTGDLWVSTNGKGINAKKFRYGSDAHKEKLIPLDGSVDVKGYIINSLVWQEVMGYIFASVLLRPPKNVETHTPLRPVTVLHCPKDGGISFLDVVLENTARVIGLDLIRLDAQDIAQIAGPYTDENLAWNRTTTSISSYNVQEAAGKFNDDDKSANNEDVDDEADEAEGISNGLPSIFSHIASINSSGKPGKLPDLLKTLVKNKSQSRSDNSIIGGTLIGTFPLPQALEAVEVGRDGSFNDRPKESQSSSTWTELKLTAAMEALVDAADIALKMRANVNAKDGKEDTANTASDAEKIESNPYGIESEEARLSLRPVIIHVRDYSELAMVPGGSDILSRLRSVINKRWQGGRRVLLVGTTSGQQDELKKADIQRLQEDPHELINEKRTILVPPECTASQDALFLADEKARIRNINLRHIEDMILKLGEGTYKAAPTINLEKDLDSATAFAAGLEDHVWSFSRVHRIATVIRGIGPDNVTGHILSGVLSIFSGSEDAKVKWAEAESKQQKKQPEDVPVDAASAEKKHIKDIIAEVRKKCNRYEQNLLNGVVFSQNIRTTFGDIRVPKETIEALKSLTSLSLLRPEAFSYGVLASDRIPGLLLYGPPGTGKTLLARAVAKESGATVLEITGADLNNMFVGEGEKNVRAVFSLAKKLSPCVVFIDEVDSVFASRETSRQRGGQREMINQFLREWDGLNDKSTFIMVATNRPFDLDDAILRRLPRRLLVDLPNESDREEILKIHLKDEALSDEVSLKALAKDTPFYSGSDLKNLSVAAALACIRDENAAAASFMATDDQEKYEYPTKRTLTKKHFDKALEEISASISEDMSSLTAIKKFDEKYGDRKGRRKKGPSMGFGGTKTIEKDSEAVRVRKSVPDVEQQP